MREILGGNMKTHLAVYEEGLSFKGGQNFLRGTNAPLKNPSPPPKETLHYFKGVPRHVQVQCMCLMPPSTAMQCTYVHIFSKPRCCSRSYMYIKHVFNHYRIWVRVHLVM